MNSTINREYNESRYAFFIRLASLELTIAGLVTAGLVKDQGPTSTLGISLIIALISITIFIFSTLLKKHFTLADRAVTLLINRYGQIVPFFLVFILIVFLFYFEPNPGVLLQLSPILFCIWLIGIETLLLFPPISQKSLNTAEASGGMLGFVGLFFAYGVALIPARIPSFLDGIPWNTSFEFIFVTLILPYSFMMGKRFYSSRFVLWISGILVILKIVLMILLPQSGMGVHIYSSSGGVQRDQWERGYDTLLNPLYTQVIQFPYTNLREFPIEWINVPGFKESEFWITLKISGTGHLEKGERMVFIVTGTKLAQIEIFDTASNQKFDAVLLDSPNKLDRNIFQQIPQIKEFNMNGTLTFKQFGQYRIEPILLLEDGTIKSIFQLPRVWVDNQEPNPSATQITALQFFLNFIGIILIGIVVFALLMGLYHAHQKSAVSTIDLYLTCTALLAFYIANQTHKPDMNTLIFFVSAILAGAKLGGLSSDPGSITGKDVLLSIGPAFLLMFIALDADSLRKIAVFPQGQDGLEYQFFARNIFLNGDIFLKSTPPRAYKVLFPYVVGFLHFLFGQSSSAQFLLSSWFALLGSVIIINIMKHYHVAPKVTYLTSVLFPLILCLPSSYIYYFRFGLIEPAAVFFLLYTTYLAIQGKIPFMVLAGILTILLRLDYLGVAFAAIFLTSNPILGDTSTAWTQLINWVKSRWKILIGYATALCVPPLIIILGYFLFTPNYVLNMSDTRQRSIVTIFEGILSVIFGGSADGLRTKFSQNPWEITLLFIPLALGFTISLVSLVYRKGWSKNIDLRWAIITISILPAYLVVRPTGYAPRFSFPLLPFDLVILGLMLNTILQKGNSIFKDNHG